MTLLRAILFNEWISNCYTKKLRFYSVLSLAKMANGALPHFASGTVIKGFGRGSKQLGIPTANYPPEVIKELPESIGTGVYYGWASVDNGPIHKMVLCIGWNPYFKNVEKSMETHIMNQFDTDFYGSNLKICMTGYIRPERDFTSLDELIAVIKDDIKIASENLDNEEHLVFKNHSFFTSNSVKV